VLLVKTQYLRTGGRKVQVKVQVAKAFAAFGGSETSSHLDDGTSHRLGFDDEKVNELGLCGTFALTGWTTKMKRRSWNRPRKLTRKKQLQKLSLSKGDLRAASSNPRETWKSRSFAQPERRACRTYRPRLTPDHF
jgi:hypothetical protein